ncbi:hypothetical protein V6N11_010118 [Hibiscus sabdariffa]|uniref:Uncharacterized protein n=1 Tax=Hibiscus sabdariffa TaxID=183260 RepID=A0ABR2PDR9_9ROSI
MTAAEGEGCTTVLASTHSSNGLKGMGNTFDEGPRDHSAVQTPQRSSASTSPRKPSYDGRTSLSSWYPSSQPSSGANSPPHGHSLPGNIYILSRELMKYVACPHLVQGDECSVDLKFCRHVMCVCAQQLLVQKIRVG